ncbi:ankyrin-2 [Penicillium lividum]|nr:ankyrin-2 [Penicillium lividum]
MSRSWSVLRENKTVGRGYVHKGEEGFEEEINKLERAFLNGLKSLTETSNDLIQLEFNLTSISEAQKSASTNKSMKRLSWITLLMLMHSLFGMNIDILASKPPWWLYIPFAILTTLLTLAVWLTFKNSNDVSPSLSSGWGDADK